MENADPSNVPASLTNSVHLPLPGRRSTPALRSRPAPAEQKTSVSHVGSLVSGCHCEVLEPRSLLSAGVPLVAHAVNVGLARPTARATAVAHDRKSSAPPPHASRPPEPKHLVATKGSHLTVGSAGDVGKSGIKAQAGNSTGILTINGNYVQSATSRLNIELYGATVGTQYDRLVVNGTVSLDGALDVTLGYSAGVGTAFLVFDNDGTDPIVGSFAGLPEASTFSAGGQRLRISYVGGTGNDVTQTVVPADVTPPTITSWASAAAHARGVGEAALTIPDDGTFVEPRLSGVSTLLARFSEAIDPATVAVGGVGVWGLDVNGQPVNLAGTTVSAAVRADGTTAALTFTPALPDYARYLVRLTGVRDLAGNPLAGDNDRLLTALLGDATGDRRTNSTDVGAVISLRGVDPIDPADVNQVRSDVTLDGRINNTDVGGVTSVRGKDARFIADPVAPAAGASAATRRATAAVASFATNVRAGTAGTGTAFAGSTDLSGDVGGTTTFDDKLRPSSIQRQRPSGILG